MLDLKSICELIRSRRSIKPAIMNPDEPVDREVLDAMLDAATWAPTHGLTQPWRFVIHEGAGRSTLGDLLAMVYEKHTPKEKFSEQKMEKMRANPRNAYYALVICMARQKEEIIPEIEEIEATACAVQNMMLVATAAGVGSFWSSGGATYYPELRDALGLDSNERVLGILYVGKAKSTPVTPPRTPVIEKIRWVNT